MVKTLDGKSPEFRAIAEAALKIVAETNMVVISDMVVAQIEAAGWKCDNYSALGGVFTRAAKAGQIQRTTEKKYSDRRTSHSAKTVWRSLIYKDEMRVSPELDAVFAMITATLEFNAVTVQLASRVVAAGPGLEPQSLKTIQKDFEKIHDVYEAQRIKIIERIYGKQADNAK